MQTTHLALPLIDAAQAQKHVTHNESLALVDALTHLAVSARGVAVPPATPSEGERLLIGAGAAGAFAGKSGQIATFLAGGWSFLTPRPGWRLYVAAESLLLLYDGANWVDLGSSLRDLGNLSRLGVGTSADAGNPLAAKLNAALFTAKSTGESGSGDLRLTLNKEAASNTASLVYQDAYSGRAEMGLSGDDDFRVKVSPDGSAWKSAIVVDRTTGAVAFPSGGPTKIVAFSSSGTYTPSPGVTLVDVILFGAGGGGGSGARQAAGAIASGGGGGGGGGVARGRFTAAQIGASRAVTIGAGGAGGATQTTNSAAGNNGASGGDTSFGALLRATGGGAGSGGGLAAGSGGGGGGGLAPAGNASGATGGAGGATGVSGGSAAAGAGSFYPGGGSGGGGSPATGDAGLQGGACPGASSGGGAGGGITAANAASNGGQGGSVYVAGNASNAQGGVAGGAINGANGLGGWANGAGPLEQAAAGGGGGASGLATAGDGGPGGFPGGGGGGGGAHQNGGSGGAGGAGGSGYAIIVEYF
ncbi:DUF2793 domain-containing protein [Methylocystis iwaonis]|uniref:Glycine-rich domain-containing protein n=1 Tax=Methylocystis iwaonis TaxID=2885079 RepID=A0ABM8E636_9HYPH|nr:DUF2793 domain-containing protein [Methylocystis iwaonis]BDV33339.1 hypothetical protein SS37A_08680 [Methylocystis iwaonis]